MTNKLSSIQKEELVAIMGDLLQPHIPALSNAFKRFETWITEVSKQHSSLLQKIPTINWDIVKTRLDEMPERSKRAMDRASNRGWFFNWQGSLQTVLTLIDDLEVANEDELDTILIHHYDLNIDGYTASLSEAFPDRQKAIAAAAGAHKRGGDDYFLSVPIFLAQADGIFANICGTTMPLGTSKSKDGVNGAAIIKEKIGENGESYDLLSPLFGLHKIDLLKGERTRVAESQATGAGFNALNRHQVLHGEVSDYGTKLNSLKAFSFLAFIGLHLPDILEATDPAAQSVTRV